jgi:hypothetical protein
MEFKNNKFSQVFKQRGIIYQTTYIDTPEQNGISERKKIDIY